MSLISKSASVSNPIRIAVFDFQDVEVKVYTNDENWKSYTAVKWKIDVDSEYFQWVSWNCKMKNWIFFGVGELVKIQFL